MATFNWKTVADSAGVIPEGVKGIFSNRITFNDYSLRFSDKKQVWQLFDDHGTALQDFANTKDGKKAGIAALVSGYEAGVIANRQVARELQKFDKELNRESLPANAGPWAALTRYEFRRDSIAK